MTLSSIQLPSLIAPSSLSLCNEKQFGVLRQAVDLPAQTEESGRRNPNNPRIEVILQYCRTPMPKITNSSMITWIANEMM